MRKEVGIQCDLLLQRTIPPRPSTPEPADSVSGDVDTPTKDDRKSDPDYDPKTDPGNIEMEESDEAIVAEER